MIYVIDGDNAGDNLGNAIAAIGDVDDDNVTDVAIGASQFSVGAGYVRVISGASGAVLYDVPGLQHGESFGGRVTGCGDIDGDGYGDFAVGARDRAQPDGGADVYSGRNGTLLHRISGSGGTGHGVAGVGDLNGDGTPDFAVGSTYEGAVRAYSGRDSSVLLEVFESDTYILFGMAITSFGDTNADSVPDIAVGAGWADCVGTDSGSVYVFDGASGELLFRVDGTDAGNGLGESLARIGDTDGDGLEEIVVGMHDVPSEAWLLSASCSAGQPENYCVGAPNSTGQGASISYSGSRSIAIGDFMLTVQGCPQRALGVFFFAHERTLSAFGDGWRCVRGQFTRRLYPPLRVNDGGDGGLLLDFLQEPTDFVPGGAANFQFWYRDPMGPGGSGFNTSNALAVMFCR